MNSSDFQNLNHYANSSLFNGIRENIKEDVCKAISLVPSNLHSEEMIGKIAQIFKDLASLKESRVSIIKSVELLTPHQRTAHHFRTLALLFRKQAKEGAPNCFKTLRDIQNSEKIEAILTQIAPFLEEEMSLPKREALLTLAARMDDYDREDILLKAFTFRKEIADKKEGISEDSYHYNIIQAVRFIPRNQREEILHLALSFLRKVWNKIDQEGLHSLKILSHPEKLISALIPIPANKRERTLERLFPFIAPKEFKETSNLYYDVLLIPEISELEEECADVVLQKAFPFVAQCTNLTARGPTLSMVAKIYLDKKEYVFEKALPYLEGASNIEPHKVLGVIMLFTEEEAAEALLFKIFQYDADSIHIFIRTFQNIPSDRRIDSIKLYDLYSEGMGDKEFNETFFRLIIKLSKNQKEGIFNHIRPFLLPLSKISERSDFLESIDLIHQEDRTENIFEDLIYLLAGDLKRIQIRTPYNKHVLLDALDKISINERGDAVKITAELIRNLEKKLKTTPSSKIQLEIFNAIGEIRDLANKLNSVQITEMLLQETFEKYLEKNGNESTSEFNFSDLKIPSILKVISKISPPNRRENLIEKAKPLIKDCTNGSIITLILQEMAKVPKTQLNALMEAALPTLLRLNDRERNESPLQAELINAMSYLSVPNRTDAACRIIVHLVKRRNQFHSGLTKEDLIPIVKTNKIDLIEKLVKLLQHLDKHRKSYSYSEKLEVKPLFDLMAQIPQEDLDANLESLVLYTEQVGATHPKLLEFFTFLLTMQKDQKNAIIRQVVPLLKKDIAQSQTILEQISCLPNRGKDSAIDLTVFILESTQLNINASALINALCFIAPGWQEYIANSLINGEFVIHSGEVSILEQFSSIPRLFKDSAVYVSNQLKSVIEDHVEARKWAFMILNDQQLFLRHGEVALVEFAQDVMINTDSGALKEPKNPYVFYETLKNTLLQESLYSKPLTINTQNKRLVSLSLDRLRKSVQETRTFIAADLPQGLSINTFKELFKELQRRLTAAQSLNRSEKSELFSEIKEIYKKPLNQLRANILEGHLIPKLLEIPSEPSAKIKKETFYLYAILRSIMDQNSTVISLLSDRERALLNFAYLVSACETGQKDGIVIYYNALDTSYRIEDRIETSHLNRLNDFINASIQSVLSNTFTHEGVIEKITGVDRVPQQSHQALYLMNRLHLQLGLKHELTFDFYTGLLMNTLLNTSRSDLIETFLTFYTPDHLISQLVKDFEKAPPSFHTAAQERLESFSLKIQELDGSFIQHLSGLAANQKMQSLGRYLLELQEGEVDATLKFHLESLEINELKMSLNEYEKKRATSLLAEKKRSGQPLTPYFQNILNNIIELKRSECLKLREELESFKNANEYTTSNLCIKSLRQLDSFQLDMSSNAYIEKMRIRGLNIDFRDYLNGLEENRLNQTLEDHLISIHEDDISIDLREFLITKRQGATLRSHLALMNSITKISLPELALKAELERKRSDFPLRILLSRMDAINPMSRIAGECLDDEWMPEISIEFKEMLRKYITVNEMQQCNLREVLKSLEEETDISEEEINEMLAPKQIMRQWQTLSFDSSGAPQLHLTEEGAFALLVEAGILIPQNNLEAFRSISQDFFDASTSNSEGRNPNSLNEPLFKRQKVSSG